MKYSFIVPAYNASKSIIACLSSICNDIKSYDAEILVIENGSSDQTFDIVENYKKETSCNIKLFSSDKGVSNARNFGIKRSKGRYLIFVDADDEWVLGSLKKIDNDLLSSKFQLGIYSYLKGNSKAIKYNIKMNSASVEEKINWIISNPTLCGTAWAKVFDKTIIEKNNIYFNSSLKYVEDTDFLIRYLQCIDDVYISSTVIYKYILSACSTIRSKNHDKVKEYEKSLMVMQSSIINDNNTMEKAFDKCILTNLNIILVHDVFNLNKDISFSKKVAKSKDIVKKEIFREALKRISLLSCFKKNLLPEIFLKLKLYYFAGIICSIRSAMNKRG